MISLFKKRDEQSKRNKRCILGIRKYLKDNNLEIDKKETNELIKLGQGVGRYYKNKYERVKKQLADAMNLKFKHMDLISNSMKTPAYPYSLQSRLIAEYYGKKYPEHKKELIDQKEYMHYIIHQIIQSQLR